MVSVDMGVNDIINISSCETASGEGLCSVKTCDHRLTVLMCARIGAEQVETSRPRPRSKMMRVILQRI